MLDSAPLFPSPALPLEDGQAPGARLAEAFSQWPQGPKPLTPHTLDAWHEQSPYVLPWAWRSLAVATGRITNGPWASHIHDIRPMGRWCPNALVLLTHEDGGRLGLDLDATAFGDWLAWWEDPDCLVRVASSWAELAKWVKEGPNELALRCHQPFQPAITWEKHELDQDPMTRNWVAGVPEVGRAQGLWATGQGLYKTGLVSRHPRQPLFWTQR